MRRTQEEAEQTRRNLLDAGLKVFSQKGYQASRLIDISKAAGVTRGAIYHHFGGKEELYFAILDQGSTKINAVMSKAISEGGTFLEVSKRIMSYSLKYLEEDPEFAATGALSLSKPPEIQKAIQMKTEELEASIEEIAKQMAQGIESGELRTELSPKNIARAFIAFQQGIMNLWLTAPKAFSVKKHAEELTDIFFNGIASHK